MLVSFDVRSEEFNMMQLQVPRNAGDTLPRYEKGVVPIEYGENVAVFDFTYLLVNGKVDLWVVEDAKKKEWSRKTLVLQPSHMHLVTDNI
ncbi:unnamed protein product [Arabidopsis lyrata]|nr:unnamed protein product [Arabidopsis lyrata]